MLSCMQKKVKLESNFPQKSMWITCTQKKVNIKSSTVQNTCMQKKIEIKSNTIQTYLIFVADAVDIVRGEFFAMWRNLRCGDDSYVEKFQMYRNFRCGEILRCGEISDVETFWIERLKFSFYYRQCAYKSLPFCHLRYFLAKNNFCNFRYFVEKLFCCDFRIFSMWR